MSCKFTKQVLSCQRCDMLFRTVKTQFMLGFLVQNNKYSLYKAKAKHSGKKVAAIHELQSFLLTLQFTTEYFSTFYFMSFIFDYILVILFHSSCIHGCWVSFGFFIFWGGGGRFSGGGGNNNTAKCCIDLFCLLIHFTHILIGLLNQCRNVLQCVESCRIFVL